MQILRDPRAQASGSQCRLGRRGAAAVEFALVAIPMLSLLMFTFEISYDLFVQEALDSGLHLAARQLQTGNAQNAQSGDDFSARFLCPSIGGLLPCSGLHVNVQKITPTAAQDYYNFTTGTLPVSNGVLDLTSYASGNFCNIGPSQLVLISAVYIGPTFIGTLFPSTLSVSYNGARVHAAMSSVGVVSENYAPSTATAGSAPSC